ncbi:MAG: carboxypeptidase-like regulatory domain-containing protein, partial [Verrucomicrobia bacterium]|nr:carboxypeptidase-like regulatory domain-containing protein [Verrucomicrobiota bacterium]
MKTNRPTSIPRVQTLFQAFALLLALALAPAAFAQGITTSAITGFVTDKQEKPVAGAAITAVHEPSGTRATAVTRANGQYNLSGLRVGGPFTISASAKDLVAEPQRDVYLGLDGA